MTPGDWATVGSAVATAVSAGVIAWQTVATRRAATASEKAVGLANSTLEQARLQTQHSLFMVAEATRARLDAEAPKLSTTTIGDQRSWEYLVSKTNGVPLEGLTQVERGHVFNSPQEDSLYLWIEVPVHIHNDGPGRADLDFYPPTHAPAPTINGEKNWVSTHGRTIEEDSTYNGMLLVGTTISGWLEQRRLGEQRRMGGPTFSPVSGGWALRLHSEAGVAQHQPVVIEGSILTPVSEGVWRLTGLQNNFTDGAELQVLPLKKLYVVERTPQEKLLPGIDWDGLTSATESGDVKTAP